MRRFFVLMLVFAGAMFSLIGPTARAENSPILRDCSLVSPPPPAVDPDFVLLSGGTLKSDNNGNLTVLPSQNSLDLTASESVDQGDQAGHVTLTATIAAPGVPARTFSGAGTGFVILELPLNGSGVGEVYTISWAATFDNGQHLCPSSITPENTTPQPFIVTVANQ
jgi:hypothetical protein